jgi:hypothetical protein
MFEGLRKFINLSAETARAVAVPQEQTPQATARNAYDRSDFGRLFGWWAVLDGRRVAELDYLSWDASGQFWHEYRLTIIEPTAKDVLLDAEKWCISGVLLESRFIPGYMVAHSLSAIHRPDRISIRAACLPQSVLDDPRLDYDSFTWREA